MRLVLLIILASFTGCATNSVEIPPDFSAYIDNLVYHPQTSVMVHNEYGEKKMNEEPLESIYKECIKSSYSDTTVNLGGVIVSDPFKLSRMKLDYTTYSFMKSLGVRMGNGKDEDKALRNKVMASPEFKNVLMILDVPSKNVRNCLTQNGWEFEAIKKLN